MNKKEYRSLDWANLCSSNPEGYEREVCQEGYKEFRAAGLPVNSNARHIPMEFLKRDMSVTASDAAGGYTVATQLKGDSFVEMLQNKMMVKQAGALVLDGLVGNIAIPTQATGATAAWETENSQAAESSPSFGQIELAPNRVGTYVDVSNQLFVQSSLSVGNIIKNMLSDSLALAIDLAALHGSGADNEPLGLAGTSGIGSVAGGTNGLAPTYQHCVQLESDVAEANGDVGSLAYITNAYVRGKLKQIYTNPTYGEIPVWHDGKVNGYPAYVSNQVSHTLTKGSSSEICSAIFFGNWADLILAFWGGMTVLTDPFTLSKTNQTTILATMYADVGVRHAASFSAMLDALT